ncbi:hypothetical protein BC629DRAFT_878664 [Irpex lacteus]|nr:hypothetical protein BC629DRAFT_878664 [Irpex lacteus]
MEPSLRDAAPRDPSLEFPGDDESHAHPLSNDPYDSWSAFIPLDAQEDPESQASVASSLAIPSLRLLRLPEHGTKPILPRSQRLAIIDGYTEIELGRDLPPSGSDKPRIRLKDMEVSKLHATIYWDIGRREWAIVDMGSKHGTFVRSHAASEVASASTAAEDPRGQRLSLPRASSIPRRLQHLDRISVGSTSFLVHIHEYRLPCKDCTSSGGDEIPLSNASRSTANATISSKRKRDDSSDYSASTTGDAKKSLSMLKRTLLSRHDGPYNTSSKGPYVDRSARRRALHPDAPGAPADPSISRTNSVPIPPRPPISSLPSPPRPPSPPAPLTSSNIGHRLLMKQGWAPGTALRSTSESADGDTATSSMDLVVPLEPKARMSRAGLGISDPAPSPSSFPQNGSWRDEGKYRRWTNTDFR